MAAKPAVARNPSASDDHAVRSVPLDMIDAWNRGNGADFAARFSADADFIAFEGTQLGGREKIAAFHQHLFDTELKGTRLAGEVKFVRFLTPNVAVVHAVGSTALAGQPKTSPSRDSMQLFVVVKRGDRWYAEAMLNARKLTLEQQFLADDLEALPPEGRRKVQELISTLRSQAEPLSS